MTTLPLFSKRKDRPKVARPRLFVDHRVAFEGDTFVAELPLYIRSEPNMRGLGFWGKASRAKASRSAARLACLIAAPRFALPIVVTLTRIAPCELDDDNIRGALKAVRDGVADAFGVNDRNKGIEWRYAQERRAARTYGVRITITPRSE